MIGTIDKQVAQKFKTFQEHEKGKEYRDLDIESLEFEDKLLKELVRIPIKGGGTPNTKIKHFWLEDFNLVDNINYFGWRNIEKELFNKKYISDYSKVITKDALDSSSSWLVPENSILIAIASASKGLTTINTKKMCTNQNILGVAINNDNDIRYVYSCLKNIYATLDSKKEFGNLTKGSEELRIVPTPKPQNNFTSYEIQKAIVAFLEFWKDDFTDVYRSKIDIMKPMLDSMKQNLITSTFELDAKIVESFNEYALDKGFDIKLEDIEFEKITLSNQKFFEINPKKSEIDKSLKDINIDISFVPLEKIDPKSGTLDGSYSKKINDVIKGYTYFKEGDVIFTKVTPSMENGNIAIAQNLINGIGFGSSEYHVFRCKNIDNRLLWMLFRSDLFREKAKKTMKGSGGLKRVPLDFFDREYFHLPKHSVYESIELQNLLVEYWEMVLENFKEREDIFSRVLELCEQIDEAFLYRTFSKIEWSR